MLRKLADSQTSGRQIPLVSISQADCLKSFPREDFRTVPEDKSKTEWPSLIEFTFIGKYAC